MMLLRFTRPSLLALFFCCFVTMASPQEYSAGEGEIRFDGTLISFDEAAKTLVISVSSFTLPNGKSSKLAIPKPKTISLLAATKMSVRNAPGVLVAPYLKAGVKIVVIGKDAGTGKDVPARLVLVIPPADESTPGGESEDTAESGSSEMLVKAGETRYEGKITGVLSPTIFTVSIALETDAQGQVTELREPQSKTVEISAQTDLHSRSDAARKLKSGDIKVGQRVTLVGKSAGRTIKAREVAIWEDDGGATRYHGSVTISHPVALLSEKGDEAHEARLYEEALKFYNQALETAQGIDDSNGQGLMYGRLGLTYRQLKQNKRAMESYQKALAVWRRVGNSASAGSSLLNISRIHAEADDLKQARTTIDEAIRALEAGGNSPVLAIAYGQRGHIQAEQDEMSEALASWQQALAISRQFNDRNDERNWLGQIAVAQGGLNQTAKATETIEQLLALIPQTADKSEQAWSHYMIGVAYRKLGQKTKAVENMQHAATIFTEAGQRENAADAEQMIEAWAKPEPQPETKPEPGAALPA